MNLVVISGKIGNLEVISQRDDGSSIIDGVLYKPYQVDGQEVNRRYFFSASGKRATDIYNEYKIGDNVVISGKLVSKVDEKGIVWMLIIVSSIARLENDELF